MANTQVLVENLANFYLMNLDSKTLAYPLVNKALEAGLLEKGETTKVKYFNNITLNTVADSGETITIDDWTEQSADLTVDQVRNKGFKIKDIEEIRSNTDVQAKLMERIAEASSQDLDSYALTTAVAGAGTVLNSGTPVTISDTNVHAEIEAMRVVLSEAGVQGRGQYLFVDPKRASILRQSNVYAGFTEGLTIRQQAALVGTLAGFTIFESNNIPTADVGVNTYMVAFDEESVHGAEQMNKFKIENEGTGAMASRLLYEDVYGMDVLGLNSGRIVANKITVA